MIVAERPSGIFTRQVFLGETLDAEHIAAYYAAGVLTLTIPVREAAATATSRSPAATASKPSPPNVGTSAVRPASCGLARRGHRGLTGPRWVGRAA
jgi:Hsp20/alpha crystallin family